MDPRVSPAILIPRVVINGLALAGVILVNYLANALPVNGLTTGEVAGRHPHLFVPAAYAFSIWGLIYLLLAGFVGYQIWSLATGDPRGHRVVRLTGGLFVISCLANMGWILAWHHEAFWLSVALMFTLLTSLVALYLRLEVSTRMVRPRERICVEWPVSVYLGWICVASIANVATALAASGWEGGALGAAFWGPLMVLAGCAIGVFVLRWRGDIVLAAAIGWALVALMVRHWSTDTSQARSMVVASAGAVAVLVIVAWRYGHQRETSRSFS